MPVTLTRDARVLAEQIQMVVDFLSDGRSDDDALATCSRGWRPLDWKPDAGPCVTTDCKATHDHSPHPRATPRWQSEVDRAVDRWPRYVVLGVPIALSQMPARDRRIVYGRTMMGLSFRKLAEQEGITHPTARVIYDNALISICAEVWTDGGEPRW